MGSRKDDRVQNPHLPGTVNHYKEEPLTGLKEMILPNKWIIH
jgi:hypothetical protein